MEQLNQTASQESNIPNQQDIQLVYISVGRRCVALIIDIIVLVVILHLFTEIFPGSCAGDQDYINVYLGSKSSTLCGVPFYLYLLCSFLYYIILEWKIGGTLGKLAVGIRVVKLDGKPIDLSASLIRNVLRIIDFLPVLYVAGAFLIWHSKKNQRLGDRIAKTVVVDKRSLSR